MPGFCESCVSGQHAACNDPQCRCLCRPAVQELMKKQPPLFPTTGTGTLVCPECTHKPRIGDTFCRFDGNKLIPGKICCCGKAGEPDDVFCGGCGQKFGEPVVPIPELSEEEITALEAKARQRPSDVEAPINEVH
jgi:hypothetical protein